MKSFQRFFKYGVQLGALAGVAVSVAAISSHHHMRVAECSGPDRPVSVRAARKYYPATEDYPDLTNHYNIMAKCMTPRLYAILRDRVTLNGVSLDQCIQVGVDNPGHPQMRTVGILAGDEECYTLFSEIFDPVIDERHGGYKPSDKHPTNLDASRIKGGNLDPDFVISCRIRGCRNIRGFCLPPACTRAERRHIESVLVQALKVLSGSMKGRYFPVKGLEDDELTALVADGIGFDRPSQYYCTATIGRDWPDARGIWYNYDKNLVAFVNECEDQLKLISVQPDGNMKEAFERFCLAYEILGKNIEQNGYSWMRNDHLGFITSCPSNLGTSLRASVFIKLPRLSQDPRFASIVKKLRLHKRALTDMEDRGVFDISNMDRLGTSEVDLIQQVIDGVHLLLRMEKRLKSDRSIDHLMP